MTSIYNDDYFFGGGAGYEDYLQEKDLLIARGSEYAALLATHVPCGQVLDVGSAAGFVLRGMVDFGWTGTGVEPNAQLSNYAREQMQLNSCCGQFDEFESDEQFDAVSLIQVVSHLIDPLAGIKKACQLLRPGGVVLIETWDRSSWTARVLRSRWHEYSPPSVLHWFSKPGLTQVVENSGFEAIVTGRPKRSIHIGHAKSLLKYKYGAYAAATLAWLPNNISIPYLADDLFWLVARKKA